MRIGTETIPANAAERGPAYANASTRTWARKGPSPWPTRPAAVVPSPPGAQVRITDRSFCCSAGNYRDAAARPAPELTRPCPATAARGTKDRHRLTASGAPVMPSLSWRSSIRGLSRIAGRQADDSLGIRDRRARALLGGRPTDGYPVVATTLLVHTNAWPWSQTGSEGSGRQRGLASGRRTRPPGMTKGGRTKGRKGLPPGP